jgi:putative heme-binding domain-containing protein
MNLINCTPSVFWEKRVKGWILLYLAVLAPHAATAQDGMKRNPRTTSEDVAAGGRIYRSHCAECHGLKGEGGRGPDLTAGVFRHGSEDADLLNTILDGVEGTEMPGVYMEDYQAWQIVAYVRSLSATPVSRNLPGDREAGERLFLGKGGCAQCHMVNGTGGRQGPDLSDVGGKRSPAFLKTALLEPSREVRRKWWPHRVTTGAGEQVSGLCLNEDTHSIQLLDTKGALRSFLRSEVREIQVGKESAMPAYGATLSDAELTDVVAYLASLRRK